MATKTGRPKSAARVEAERLVKLKEFADVPTRTLAKRLSSEYKITVEQARNLLRAARGAKGKKDRKNAVVKRPKGKAGYVPKMPPSKAEDWEPFEINESKIAILSDIHVPYHHEIALQAAVDYCKTREPDCLLLNGDALDFYSISRWQKDPKKRNFKAELEACTQLLQWLRHEFGPECRIVCKKGNHEERWDHYLWNHAAELSDHPNMLLENFLEFDKYEIEMVEDQRPILCGKLPVFHGHELGRSIFSPVNPARGAFLRTHHTVLVGHSHQTSGHADTNVWHEETFIWSTGCLCHLNPEYARVNRWNLGFAFVTVDSDGSFSVDNCRITREGKVRE